MWDVKMKWNARGAEGNGGLLELQHEREAECHSCRIEGMGSVKAI